MFICVICLCDSNSRRPSEINIMSIVSSVTKGLIKVSVSHVLTSYALTFHALILTFMISDLTLTESFYHFIKGLVQFFSSLRQIAHKFS